MKKNKKIKFISTFLLVLIIAPTFLFSQPKHAQAYVVAAVPVNETGFMGILRNIFLGTTGVSTATNTAISVKNVAIEIARQVIMTVERALLQKMTQATVNWINSGFHGSPLFLQNSDSFFKDIAKTEIKNLINDFGYDPNRFPFGKAFALNTIDAYKRAADTDAAYSLSAVMNPIDANNFRNNFSAGGWNGFLTNTQYPQNNYLGFQMIATDKLARQLQGTTQNAAQKVQTTLNQGMGFLSPQTCPSNQSYNNGYNEFNKPAFQSQLSSDLTSQIDECYGPVGSVSAPGAVSSCITAVNTSYQNKLAAEKAAWAKTNSCPGGLVATTPGAVVGNQIIRAMGSTFSQSELAAALGNSISAILNTLLSHFLDKGLTDLGGLVNSAPSIDNWTYNGLSLGSSNPTGTTGTTPPAPIVTPSTKTVDFNNPATQNIHVDPVGIDTAGGLASITISGGTEPYSIQTDSDSTIAITYVSGTTLTIAGNNPGTTSVVIKDSSAKTMTVHISVGTETDLSASSQSITTDTTSSATIVTISGGTPPYTIDTQPDTNIAAVSLVDNTLTVGGLGEGTTKVVIKDSYSPAKTIEIPITISDNGGNGGTGTVNFDNPLPQNVPATGTVSGTTNLTLSGGTGSYTIAQWSNTAIAKLFLDGATLAITGVSAGLTSVILQDSSGKMITVDITINPAGTP